MGILFIKRKKGYLTTKKCFKIVIEILIVSIFLTTICMYINRDIVLKGLFMDDLANWSWFRGLSFYDFAIKFYNSTRYRPVFEGLQYLIYTIVGTDPTRFTLINKIYNIVIALFIYYFVRKLNAGIAISFITSVFYIIAHYAYYQIGQAIGTIESTALFLSLIVLFLCLRLIGIIEMKKKLNIKLYYRDRILNIFFIFITYFLLVFDHERFLGTASIIVIAILFMPPIKHYGINIGTINDSKVNTNIKIICLFIYAIEIVVILLIRYLAIGKVIPAGTGGTYVEDTFNFNSFISYCLNQVAIIFGINIGPEHLVGISFSDIADYKIKYTVFISIAVIAVIIVSYVIVRVKNIIYKKENKNIQSYLNVADLIFLVFIASCIASSSVTIRVELRFVYVSFVASLIYLAYMCTYLFNRFDNYTVKVVYTILFVTVFIVRLPAELLYRNNFKNIYCYIDTKRINSLYDFTMGIYGVSDVLHNKKVYLVGDMFGMTNFYAEYFYKIYDKDNVGNKIILIDNYTNLPIEALDDESIVLYENYSLNCYSPLEIK